MILHRIDRDEAFRYMGLKGNTPPENISRIADECEELLMKSVTPAYVWKMYDISHTDGGIAVSGTELLLKGRDISEHLKDCHKCILMCATLSAGADRMIKSCEVTGMEKAVIADCLASAAAEQICNTAEAEIQQTLSDCGYYYTWRFSPGYGDLPIDIQPCFLKALDAQKRIGVTVTESYILIPRKSVTAIIGISDKNIPKGKRGCTSCNMKDRCKFRKNGTHCG